MGVASSSGTGRAVLRLLSLMRRVRPDVLHAHLSHASFIAALATRLESRASLVQTRHYSDYMARFRPYRLQLDAWAARRCDVVVAVSESARDHLVRTERVVPSRTRVIENGVDVDRLQAFDPGEARERLRALGVPAGALLGCAASFDVRKGHPHLIRALRVLRDDVPDVQLVLLGTGSGEASVRQQVRALGLEGCVHFLGHRGDGQALMAGFDVYVQPSIEEGFGLAVVEAMAMRRPVVVSAVGGMLRTVEPGVSGLHVPPGDAPALASALRSLLASAERRAELGRNAAARVRERYSTDAMLDAYDEAYRWALAHRRTGLFDQPRPRVAQPW